MAVLLGPLHLPAQQFEPEGSHVFLFFPQLADGGGEAQKWQTQFVFKNPHDKLTSSAQVDLVASDGKPLYLDFGSGPTSTLAFSVPPGGTRVFRSLGRNQTTQVGWARGGATLPLQSTVLFRATSFGQPSASLSAAATVPTKAYFSYANNSLGIAVANPFTITNTLIVVAKSTSGSMIGTGQIILPPSSHRALGLSQVIVGLRADFEGSIEIWASDPRYTFLAWTVNSEAGFLSNLPKGEVRWPKDQVPEVYSAYSKALAAAGQVYEALGQKVDFTRVDFAIDFGQTLQASASINNQVRVSLGLAELISDSPSELAFILGHELAHIARFQTGRIVAYQNPEHDADFVGLFVLLLGGYDPYGGAGALAKLAMATNSANLVSQSVIDHFDLHGSINTRIQLMFDSINIICNSTQGRDYCQQYKRFVHPTLPPQVPLGGEGSERPGLTIPSQFRSLLQRLKDDLGNTDLQ